MEQGSTIDSSGNVVLGVGRAVSSIVSVPAALAVAGTPICSSVRSAISIRPAVGYVMAKAGITLSDVSYTRPRQSICVHVQPTLRPARNVP